MGTFGIIMLVLSAAMTAIGTGLNYYYQDKTNKEQMDFAREQQTQQQQFEQMAAKTANDRSLDMFYQTQSPHAKMEMIKNAGLSPGLIYGGGAATQGSAAAAAKASSNAIPMPNIQTPFNGDYLNNLSNIMNNMADSDTERKRTEEDTKKIQKEVEALDAKIKETEANTKKIEEEAKTEVVTRNYTELQSKLAEKDLEFQNATFDDRVNIITEQLNEIRKNIEKTGKEIEMLDIEKEWKPKLYRSTLQLNNAQIQKIAKEKLLIMAQTTKAKAEKLLIDEQKAKTEQEKHNLQSERKKTEREVEKLEYVLDDYELWGAAWTESNGIVDNLIQGAKWTLKNSNELMTKGRMLKKPKRMQGRW